MNRQYSDWNIYRYCVPCARRDEPYGGSYADEKTVCSLRPQG